MYVVSDIFSGMIAGLYVGLEEPTRHAALDPAAPLRFQRCHVTGPGRPPAVLPG